MRSVVALYQFRYAANQVRFYNDKNMLPVNSTWHQPIPDVVYHGMDWDCPAWTGMLGLLLRTYHGNISVETTIRNINPIVQTGSLHVAIYEVERKQMYIAQSAGSSHAPGAPLKAYERPYMKFDVETLFTLPRPDKSSDPCESGFRVRGDCVPVGVSPLDFYVNHVEDDKFQWTGPHQQFAIGGATAYVLNLTSQSWLSPSDFKTTSAAANIWSHQLIVVVPNVTSSTTGWLWITGGENNNKAPISPVDTEDSEVALAAALATATETVCSVLKQVPNQPVQFAVDIPHPSNMYPEEQRSEVGACMSAFASYSIRLLIYILYTYVGWYNCVHLASLCPK